MRSSSRRAAALSMLALSAVGVSLTACGGDDDEGNGGGGSVKGREVVFNLAGRQIPYYRDLAEGMTAEAKRQGIKLTPVFGDQQVPTQVGQVENAIVRRPDGLVIGPIDQEALIPSYRKADQAKIPVATVSDNIGEDGRSFQLSYVGHPYEELGRKKARWIVDHLGGKGTVGMIHAIRGGNFTEEQDKGAKEVFSQNPGIKLVDGPYVGDFTADAGLKGTENLLSRTQQIDAIYYDNDDIALGGLKGVAERNIPKDEILVVGTDGGPDAIDAVRQGNLDYTISLCGYAQGAAAIRTLADYFRTGKEPGPLVKTRQVDYTTDTVAAKLEALKTPDCNAAVDTEEQ